MAKIKPNPNQGLLFQPPSTWKPPAMSELPDWSGAKRIGLDIETRDPLLKTLGPSVRRGGYIVGVSFCIEGDRPYYLPMKHEGGDNLPFEQVMEYLKAQAKAFTGEFVGANLVYDLDYLWEAGVEMPHARFRDVQIAEPLIWEHSKSFSLNAIAGMYDMPLKDEKEMVEAARQMGLDPKSDMWRLPARYVGAYAEWDAELPLKILREQEKRIEEQELGAVWELETDVLPALLRMQRRGVRLDLNKLEYIENWTREQEAQALAAIRHETGVTTDRIDQTDEVKKILRAIGVTKIPRTDAGADSIDKHLLSTIDHPVARHVERGRKVRKLRETFVKSVHKFRIGDRLHPNFVQIRGEWGGTISGRLACARPNIQQQPSRDDFANMWRSIYIPEHGAEWGCLDYSQQEPRWTTHFAASSPIAGRDVAQKAAQAYWDDPNIDNHQFMADLTGLPRKFAKNLYLGLCYGEGGAKLCHDLGLPSRWGFSLSLGRKREFRAFDTYAEAREEYETIDYRWKRGSIFETSGEEGQKIIDEFNSRAPFIKQLADLAQQKAERAGYIRTILGRRLRFQWTGNRYDWTYKALNRLIQGSSADQTKKALVTIDREMPNTFLQLQVHDELDGSFGSSKEAHDCAEIMKEAIPDTKVPFRVDVEMGQSWGELNDA